MSIKFDPDEMLKKIAPTSKIKRMVNRKNLTLKRAALSFVDDIDILDKRAVTKVALKTIKGYKKRIREVVKDTGEASEGTEEKNLIGKNPKQLIQRVQNELVWQLHQGIKEKYKGKRGRWLPSSANEPDPLHQKNYGKEYVIGEGINGEEPGDRYGCQCGVEILVNETSLELD